MTKRNKNLIDKEVKAERECGHLLCDFDDHEHDLRMIAEVLGYDVWWDDDDEIHFEDQDVLEEALTYYYELHA